MLTRIYIDNFRCLVNFELQPNAPQQLIIGSNGSGKSSLMDALLFIRLLSIAGVKPEDLNILGQRTRWMSQPRQTFEIGATLDNSEYTYKLIIDGYGDPPRPRVLSETVQLDGKPIFEFQKGEVHLFNDRFQHKVTYPFDWHRSALATITPRPENTKLTHFREWFGGLYCFRLNPFDMAARAEREDLYPNVNLSNISAWYRHLVQNDPKENAELLTSLRAAIDGFDFLELTSAGENVRLLLCEFERPRAKFSFHELSDGQRCLICLYTIAHFVVGKGGIVVIDEPDNFISLREIQPWISVVSELTADRGGQVILISHHPEVINQWAPSYGVQFVRDGEGPVRARPFQADTESALAPAELIARGWERE